MYFAFPIPILLEFNRNLIFKSFKLLAVSMSTRAPPPNFFFFAKVKIRISYVKYFLFFSCQLKSHTLTQADTDKTMTTMSGVEIISISVFTRRKCSRLLFLKCEKKVINFFPFCAIIVVVSPIEELFYVQDEKGKRVVALYQLKRKCHFSGVYFQSRFFLLLNRCCY